MAARGTTGFPREGRLSPRTQTDNYLCFVDLKQIKKQMFVILSEINPLSDESFLNLFEKNLLGSIRRHFPLVFGWFKSNFEQNEFFEQVGNVFLGPKMTYFAREKGPKMKHFCAGKKVQKWIAGQPVDIFFVKNDVWAVFAWEIETLEQRQTAENFERCD